MKKLPPRTSKIELENYDHSLEIISESASNVYYIGADLAVKGSTTHFVIVIKKQDGTAINIANGVVKELEKLDLETLRRKIAAWQKLQWQEPDSRNT